MYLPFFKARVTKANLPEAQKTTRQVFEGKAKFYLTSRSSQLRLSCTNLRSARAAALCYIPTVSSSKAGVCVCVCGCVCQGLGMHSLRYIALWTKN